MESSSRPVARNPSGGLWLCLVCLAACKLGAAAPASTCPNAVPTPAVPLRDAAPSPAPAGPPPAECRSPSGELLAELSQTQVLDIALTGDSLLVLIKEDKRWGTRVLRVRTDRAWTDRKIVGECSAGAGRIAADAGYLYLPCLGALPAHMPPNAVEPHYTGDGYVRAIPVEGGHRPPLVPQARSPFWVGIDSSFVYWFGGQTLYRLPRPRPDASRDSAEPEPIASISVLPQVFVGSDGVYMTNPGTVLRAAPGRLDQWSVPNLAAFLGLGARDEILVQVEGHPESVFRFVPESSALVPVARIDQPVMGILWLRDGNMLVRSQDTLWRATFAGGSPTTTTRWRRFPRTIVGWVADEHTLYLALKGSPLDQDKGFGLYALPLGCGPTVEPGGAPR